jgi:ribosomal protein S18 acetylase RimI-like enzyme
MDDEANRDLVLPDLDLVRRAQAICASYKVSRIQIIADRPGNPLNAEVRHFGEATACRSPIFGEHLFNRALGFTNEHLNEASEVIDWYEEADVTGAFEIAPGPASDQLMELLHARGFRHTGFHAVFVGRATGTSHPQGGVEVMRLDDARHLEAFSDAYHLGWASTGPRIPVEPWLRAPGWSLYLGMCDGAPAGAAVLYLSDGDGYLADGAVDPKWRRRGIHWALLDRRCADASAEGADIIFSAADFLSTSHRNMLRKGLALLFTKAIWTRRL